MWCVSEVVDITDAPGAPDWEQFANGGPADAAPPGAPNPYRALAQAMCGSPAMGAMLTVRPLRDLHRAAEVLQKHAAENRLRDVRLADPHCDTVCLELCMDRNTYPSTYLLCPRTGSRDPRVQLVRRAYD